MLDIIYIEAIIYQNIYNGWNHISLTMSIHDFSKIVKLQLVENSIMHACSAALCLKLSFFSLKHTFYAETVIYWNFAINFSKSLFKSYYADVDAIINLK